MGGNELARRDAGGLIHYNQEQIDLLKRTVAEGTSNDEFSLFCGVVRRTGLDPFSRQIHCVMRKSKVGTRWVQKMSIQTGIDGYRLIAERTRKYAGQDDYEFYDKEAGTWTTIWIKEDPPFAARCRVYRHDSARPFQATVYYDALVQRKADGSPNHFWRMPKGVNQLGKCAEAAALRKAFPQELSDVYTDEEMPRMDDHDESPQVVMPQRKSERAPETPLEPGDAIRANVVEQGTWSGVVTKVAKIKDMEPDTWKLYTDDTGPVQCYMMTREPDVVAVATSAGGKQQIVIDWRMTGGEQWALTAEPAFNLESEASPQSSEQQA